MRESLYSVSLGSPPRIAMLTAGYKGLFSRFFINKATVVVAVVSDADRFRKEIFSAVLHRD